MLVSLCRFSSSLLALPLLAALIHYLTTAINVVFWTSLPHAGFLSSSVHWTPVPLPWLFLSVPGCLITSSSCSPSSDAHVHRPLCREFHMIMMTTRLVLSWSNLPPRVTLSLLFPPHCAFELEPSWDWFLWHSRRPYVRWWPGPSTRIIVPSPLLPSLTSGTPFIFIHILHWFTVATFPYPSHRHLFHIR